MWDHKMPVVMFPIMCILHGCMALGHSYSSRSACLHKCVSIYVCGCIKYVRSTIF